MKWFFIIFFGFIAVFLMVYILFYVIATYIDKGNKAKSYVGIFVLDLEKTDLGIYSDSIELYKDLTIEFKRNGTFKFNKSVPFIADTTGYLKTARAGRWNEIYYNNWKGKITNDQIGHIGVYDGDSIFYINSVTPRADQIGKSNVYQVFFRKISDVNTVEKAKKSSKKINVQ